MQAKSIDDQAAALVLVSSSPALEACWHDWLNPWWGGPLYCSGSIEQVVTVLQQQKHPILLLDVSNLKQEECALTHLRHRFPGLPCVLLLHEPPSADALQTILDNPLNDYLPLGNCTRDTVQRVIRHCLLQLSPSRPGSRAPAALDGYDPQLWRALHQEQFELFYQPRIDLRRGTICGAETLLRWHHPERGLVLPDNFIPACEASGLIVPLGYWIIRSALRNFPALQAAGLAGRIGINLSFRQFQDSFLATTIERLLDQQPSATRQLEFELTETALFNDEEHVRTTIKHLSRRGIEFSLDDFGTGYSSFSLLQKLPIHTLKIDKSFVAGIPGNQDDEEIVRAIINLAHSLNKQVIAEGVETRAQLEFLSRHGCDQVQGFFFSRPIPLPRFLGLLNQPLCQYSL